MAAQTTRILATTLAACLAACLAPGAAFGVEPVQMDIPGAHLVILRQLDVWSGNTSALEGTLQDVRDKQAGYTVELEPSGEETAAGRYWIGKPSDNPVMVGAAQALQQLGVKVEGGAGRNFKIQRPKPLDPAHYADLRLVNETYLKRLIVSEGDPDQAAAKVSARKFAGGLLSLLTVGVAGAKFGAVGAETILNTGIPGDAYQWPLGVPHIAAPTLLPELDTTGFKQMEVYPVSYIGDIAGEVIVGYTEAKTPEIATDALVHAIVTLSGADTTPEAIEASRAADLAYRKRVWADCVAAGECK